MPVDFGFSLPFGPPAGQINKWLDDLEAIIPQLEGHFKSLWMTDHFFWGDAPTYECWTALVYAAARWPRFDVGPMVLGQGYRNPALTAKMGATLQALTGGRFIMGFGAGWKEDEYHAYGYGFPNPGVRVAQLEDALEIINRMWRTTGQVTFHGQYYSVTDAYCEPKPVPVPPIIVGGGGTKTTWLAVRFADWWNMHDVDHAGYVERLDMLKQHCAELERDLSTLRLTWFGRLVVGRTEAKVQERGGGKWTPENAFIGTPQQIVEQMMPLVEEGVDYFMVDIPGLSDPDVMGLVLEDILPKLH
jgi:alkanesulfonate monooxygenase SsuD/methylene tetrahydromethanopterin reductase-like flavin-dependent oxidoreductase (luciferase family)